MPKIPVNSEELKEIPFSDFAGQNQSSVNMRIIRSDTKPTSTFEGFIIPPNGVVDTETHTFLQGKCWLVSESGKNHDFYYEKLQ